MKIQRSTERSTGRSTGRSHGPRAPISWRWRPQPGCLQDQGSCARPIQHRNKAPTFYTAWEQVSISCRDVRKADTLNRAMAERFKTRTGTTPLPQAARVPKYPQCACCFAKFVLEQ